MIKLLSICTPETKILRDAWFLKTLKDRWQVSIKDLEHPKEGKGDYLSPSWFFCIEEKIKYLIEEIKNNQGDVIVWADIDIQFFGSCDGVIGKALQDHDIVFQAWDKERKRVNTGFMAIRCNPKTLLFFESVLRSDWRARKLADQDAVNDLLRMDPTLIRWSTFSTSVYSINLGDVPLDIVLHHACCTDPPHIRNGVQVGSIELKIALLKKIRARVRSLLLPRIFHWVLTGIKGTPRL